jgi:formate C-acetyltransferase
MMTERVKRLKSKIITSGQHIGIEKFKIIVASEKQCTGYPAILRRGITLKNVLERMPIFILPDELIVGNPASRPWGLEIEAGLGRWDKDEVDALRTDGFQFDVQDEIEMLAMNEQFKPFGMYDGANLIVAADERLDAFARCGMMLAPWKKDKTLGNRVGGGAACSGLGNGPGWNLLCIDFSIPLTKGINALIEECRAELKNIRYFDNAAYERGISLQGMIASLEGLVNYALRFAALADDMALKEENPRRKTELQEIAEICRRVPAYPARTFREALQCFWFVFLLMNPSPTPAMGRFDQYMYPYYKADIDAGRITNAEVLEYLCCLRIRCMELNQQSGKEIRKRASGGARWINMTIGGVKADGSDATNDLTHLIIDALLECPTTHHTITLRVAESTPDSIMLKAITAQAKGMSMPAFVGDKSYINYFNCPDDPEDGLDIETARDYCMTGCIDGNIAGRTRTMGITMFVVPMVLDMFMHDGWDRNIGVQVGNVIGRLDRFTTYDDFLAAFKEEFAFFIKLAAEKLNIESIVFRNMFPDPFRAAMMDGGVQSGLDCYAQPYKFENNQLLNPVGMINLAQSLYTIKRLVYEEKAVSLAELKNALDADWSGYEDLRKKALGLSHYGNGIGEIDDIVADCYTFWADVAATIPSILGGHFRCSAISVTSHQPGGALVGATPDGRRAGEILADACASPLRGTDTKGPLAVFRSALRIPQDRFQAMLMNMKIHPSALKTDEDKMKLASAIRTYFSNGGKQVQFIVADAKELADARVHPADHRDLMVRVAGYSAYFVQLTPGLQDEVIARTEHDLENA